MTWSTIPDKSYFVPTSSPTADVQVFADVATSYLNSPRSDNSVCTRTYTLMMADGVTPYSGSFLTLTGKELKVDIDQINSENVKLKVVQDGVTVVSNPTFNVNCVCNTVGYTVSPTAALTALNNFVNYPIDGNTPTYPSIKFTPD